MLNGQWADASDSLPSSFWDDITEMREYLPQYRQKFTEDDVTLGDKVRNFIFLFFILIPAIFSLYPFL